jgi:hypothetical protein
MIGKVPGKSHLEHFITSATNSSKTSEVLREHEGNGQDFVGRVYTGMHTAASTVANPVGIVPYTHPQQGRRDGTQETTATGGSDIVRIAQACLLTTSLLGVFLKMRNNFYAVFKKTLVVLGC